MNYRQRHIEARITKLADSFPILLVSGARQAGKSTLLTALFPEADCVVFDPVIDVGGARRDPEFFLAQHRTPLILDEVQYAPELLGVIKRWSDRDPAPGRYLLTGSQNLMVLKSVSESMAGRVVVLELPFLSLSERCAMAGSPEPSWIDDLFSSEPFQRLHARSRLEPRALEPTLFARVWRGGFPRLLDLPDDVLPDAFASYLRTYVERDIRQVAAVDDQQLFSRFVALCAALTAHEINHSQLGRELGVSHQTAQRWLSALVSTYQWVEVPPWHGNTVKRVSMRSKGYFADTGFAAWLNRISSPIALGGHPLQGALFETHVVLDTLKQLQRVSAPPRAWHWRSHSGAEVDLLLERDGMVVPIEIKSSARVTRGDARGILAFRDTYPGVRHGPGVILAAVEHAEPVGDNVIALPYDLA
jgi:predicted AAA+ superfamily ATPase